MKGEGCGRDKVNKLLSFIFCCSPLETTFGVEAFEFGAINLYKSRDINSSFLYAGLFHFLLGRKNIALDGQDCDCHQTSGSQSIIEGGADLNGCHPRMDV